MPFGDGKMINSDLKPYLALWQAHRDLLCADASHGQSRLHFEAFARAHRQPLPDEVTVREILIPFENRFLRALLFRPKGAGPFPAVFYIHGGAFTEGSPETHFDTTAAIAAQTGAVVISLAYSLTPENPFPIAVDECCAALDWVFDCDTLEIDPERLAVWGDSAGANLAAVAVLARRGMTPAPLAQLLHYPVLDFTCDRPSYVENADGPIVKVAHMPYIDGIYCTRPRDKTDPRAAPLCAPDHSGLPPTYIGLAEHDPLRDDGYDYAEKLRAAGVSVDVDPGIGLIHAYLRAVHHAPSAAAGFSKAIDWLNDRL